jgi:hypothetical protein
MPLSGLRRPGPSAPPPPLPLEKGGLAARRQQDAPVGVEPASPSPVPTAESSFALVRHRVPRSAHRPGTCRGTAGANILPGMSTRPRSSAGPPMTLGNMRANGVRSLDVSCWQCQHRTRERGARSRASAIVRAAHGVHPVWHRRRGRRPNWRERLWAGSAFHS